MGGAGGRFLHLERRWADPDQPAERTQTRQQEAGSCVSSGNPGISVSSVKELGVMPGFTFGRGLKT